MRWAGLAVLAVGVLAGPARGQFVPDPFCEICEERERVEETIADRRDVARQVTVRGAPFGQVRAELRLAGSDAVLATGLGATPEQAVAAALAAAGLDRLAGRARTVAVDSSGSFRRLEETGRRSATETATRREQRDALGPGTLVFNGFNTDLSLCDPVQSSCGFAAAVRRVEDGVRLVLTAEGTVVTTTTTVEEAERIGGTALVTVALAAPGTGHGAAQSTAFVLADRFLGRLLELDGEELRPLGVAGGGWSGFVEAVGGFGRHDGAVEAPFRYGGARAGLVRELAPGLLLGLVTEGVQSRTRVETPGVPETTDATSSRTGAMLAVTPGAWSFGLAAFAGLEEQRSRADSLAGGGRSSAAYSAASYGGGWQLGATLPLGAWRVTPRVAFSWLGWSAGSFAEQGGVAPLTVAGAERRQTRSVIGVRLQRDGELFERPLRLVLHPRLVRVGGDRRGAVQASDGLTGPGAFAVTGPGLGRDAVELEAMASLALPGNLLLRAAWTSRFSDGADEHAGRLTLRFAF